MTCQPCAAEARNPDLLAACAAAGGTDTVLARYLTGYHERNHQ